MDRGDRREDILVFAVAQVSAVLGWPSEARTSSLADLMTRSTFRLAWVGVRSAWLWGFLLLAASTVGFAGPFKVQSSGFDVQGWLPPNRPASGPSPTATLPAHSR